MGDGKKINGSYSPFTVPFLSDPGTQTNIEEQADILGEYFSAVSSSSHYSESFLKYKNTAERQRLPTSGGTNEPYNNLLTVQEINRVLSAGKQTAPGPDEIHYHMLAHLSEPAVEALLNFLTKFGYRGNFPKPGRWPLLFLY